MQIKLDTLWKDNQYYLGEWHYHPNSSPTPSRSDIEQMLSLSHDKKLIILGGNKDNWLLNVIVIANEKIVSFHEVK